MLHLILHLGEGGVRAIDEIYLQPFYPCSGLRTLWRSA